MHQGRILVLLFILGLSPLLVSGQNDTTLLPTASAPDPSAHIRVSLITCGPGFSEIYEVFGHTAIRIIDSVHHTDMVFNYGAFNGFEKNFELKFMQGKLPYYLLVEPFGAFVEEYVAARRTVHEQLLLLNDQQKKEMLGFLDWNAEPANRVYKYDFFFDNCATRIRDIFENNSGKGFKYSRVLPDIKHYTFRDIINERFYATVWERFGINILLGSRIDKVMTDKDIMFLPDYLSLGAKGATINGQPFAAPAVQLLVGDPPVPPPVNGPLLMNWGIAVLTIVGLSVKRARVLGKIMTFLLLFVTGLLGCLILVMWFATDHQGCGNNFNIMWTLPINLLLAFKKPKGSGKYAAMAILFIVFTVFLHILGVQQIILAEFVPLLLAMVAVFGSIYRNSK